MAAYHGEIPLQTGGKNIKIIRGWRALVSTWSQSKIDPCVRWKVKPRIYLLDIILYSQLEYYIIKPRLQNNNTYYKVFHFIPFETKYIDIRPLLTCRF